MNRDAQMKGYERMQRLKIPDRFKDYRVILVELPRHPEYDLVYDMPNRTIWITFAPGWAAVLIHMVLLGIS